MRFFRNAMIIMIILVVVAIGGFCGFYYYAISPISSDVTTIVVEIPLGTSRETIFKMLKDKGLIRNTNIMKLYLKLNSIDSLQAGNYELNKSMPISKIVDKLQNGKVMKKVNMVTIKEGKNGINNIRKKHPTNKDIPIFSTILSGSIRDKYHIINIAEIPTPPCLIKKWNWS